jgi:integrase
LAFQEDAVPTVNLTEKKIERLKAPDQSGKQVIHWDDELRGFGVLCSGVSNAKTFIVQRALRGTGRTRRVTVASVAELPLKEARDRAAKLLLEMRDGQDPKPHLGGTSKTLRQVLDDYIKARASLSERSKRSYRDLVTLHLPDWLDRELKSITPDMVEARHGTIKESVEARGRFNGFATANGVMVALRTLWNYQADRDETMPASPTRRLKRSWFAVPRRERHVRAEQLPAFYQAVLALPNPVARDYLLLLLFTGLRRSEAASLTWNDVDMAARVIHIPAPQTKAKRKLDLPMSDVVHGIFMERQRLGREKYVFPATGAGGYIQEPKFPLGQVAVTSGIKVSVHDLRRSYLTVAESANVPPLQLKALVNHAMPRDVTAGYIQMTVEALRGPAPKPAAPPDEPAKPVGKPVTPSPPGTPVARASLMRLCRPRLPGPLG